MARERLLYGNPLYQAGGCRVTPCPVAEACIKDAFWSPHRVLMGEEEDMRELAAIVRGKRGAGINKMAADEPSAA